MSKLSFRSRENVKQLQILVSPVSEFQMEVKKKKEKVMHPSGKKPFQSVFTMCCSFEIQNDGCKSQLNISCHFYICV